MPVGGLADPAYRALPSYAGEAIRPCTALPLTISRDQTKAPVAASRTAKRPSTAACATTSRPSSSNVTGAAPTSRSRSRSGYRLASHLRAPVEGSKASTPSSGLPTPTNATPCPSMAGVDHTPSPGAQSVRTHTVHRTRPVAASRPNSRPGTNGMSPYGDDTPTITRSRYATGDAHTAAFGGADQSQMAWPPEMGAAYPR